MKEYVFIFQNRYFTALWILILHLSLVAFSSNHNPISAIAKEVKNLSKHDAVVKHAQSRFNEEIGKANDRVKRAFMVSDVTTVLCKFNYYTILTYELYFFVMYSFLVKKNGWLGKSDKKHIFKFFS